MVSTGDAVHPWTGILRYATDLFDDSTIAGMSDRFVRLIAALTAVPMPPWVMRNYSAPTRRRRCSAVRRAPMSRCRHCWYGSGCRAGDVVTRSGAALWFRGRGVLARRVWCPRQYPCA